MTEKYCVKCGKKFMAIGRQVICPQCKEQTMEETKRAAVLKAKRASWTGESVPVRISGRASTVIREYGAVHNLPFARALDALLQASDYVKSSGKAWEEVEPYKSRRRDKHTTETYDAQTEQEQPQEVKQAAKQASKTTSKASTSKTAGKATDASKKGERKA